jgi:hypothetical protein
LRVRSLPPLPEKLRNDGIFTPRRFSHLVQIFRFSQASWRQNGDMGDSRQKNKTPSRRRGISRYCPECFFGVEGNSQANLDRMLNESLVTIRLLGYPGQDNVGRV